MLHVPHGGPCSGWHVLHVPHGGQLVGGVAYVPHGGQCSEWRVCLTVGSAVGGVCASRWAV